MKHKLEHVLNCWTFSIRKLDSLAKHHYNWLQKAKECRALKESLREDEIALHVDFSENFSCKLNSELQAFHFGESRKQATVHTCGLYSSRLYQASPSLHPLGMIRELCGLTWSQCWGMWWRIAIHLLQSYMWWVIVQSPNTAIKIIICSYLLSSPASGRWHGSPMENALLMELVVQWNALLTLLPTGVKMSRPPKIFTTS